MSRCVMGMKIYGKKIFSKTFPLSHFFFAGKSGETRYREFVVVEIQSLLWSINLQSFTFDLIFFLPLSFLLCLHACMHLEFSTSSWTYWMRSFWTILQPYFICYCILKRIKDISKLCVAGKKMWREWHKERRWEWSC